MVNFLKKIFSFGFNKDGLSHWIWQRITAFLMIFLLIQNLILFPDQ